MRNKTQQQQKSYPPQHQSRKPGLESEMTPRPISEGEQPQQKLRHKVALITGGDSGIGRAIAIAYAQHGAKVVIAYLNEHEDAEEAKALVESHHQPCLLVSGDIGDEAFCQQLIDKTIEEYGKLDILVNNAGEHTPQKSIEDISSQQLEETFRTDFFGMFYLTKAALKHMKAGACIINTASVTAYKGSPELLDYSASKGAIVAFTRSLSLSLAEKGIRVNGVAPGPIWTPLIPSSFPPEEVASFGENVPMKRAGQPEEVAPSYVFLASDDASYMSGQMLHPNGGTIING
jgi:NAD(P)-dependent dehydrogenase (short-subunit alcohol dehydrogenase family)